MARKLRRRFSGEPIDVVPDERHRDARGLGSQRVTALPALERRGGFAPRGTVRCRSQRTKTLLSTRVTANAPGRNTRKCDSDERTPEVSSPPKRMPANSSVPSPPFGQRELAPDREDSPNERDGGGSVTNGSPEPTMSRTVCGQRHSRSPAYTHPPGRESPTRQR